MSSTPRLTVADLDRLESLLSAEHLADSMTLDALQGLFCAVASAPAPIPPEQWLATALGEHTFASGDEENEITDLLTRFCNDTARDLAAGAGLDVISYPAEEGEEELAVWCEGYLVGVGIADPDWFTAGDEESVAELLFPFMALSGRLKEHALESGEPWEEGEREAELMAGARDAFYDTVEEAHQYWFETRINRVPQKRDGEKVGRNDPCPCGSGKKYKACHGAG
ncbi:MAG TPA: UPF0149 family protein [Usitatibacteraceae bacterium]|nr:UPF0149 family protein [Usitatibacteraceae bacterium]